MIRTPFLAKALVTVWLATAVLPAQTWTELRPAERSGCQLVHDAARDRLVLFAGTGTHPWLPRTDTWEHDGTRWHRIATAHPAPGRASATYDAGRQRLVALAVDAAGNVQTCEYDGSDWSTVATAHVPLGSGPLAYDAARGRVQLYASNATTALLYEYDGVDWSARPSATTPRDGIQVMAYDAARQRLVLTGTSGFPYHSLTWEHDGVDWSPVVDPNGPYEAGMLAYDARRQTTVFFGAYGLWERQGGAWQWITVPGNRPMPRAAGGLCWDAHRGRLVLFGGSVPWGSFFVDLWSYDGSAFRDLDPHPQTNTGGSFTYDGGRGTCVGFGGASLYNLTSADTWQGDGTRWSVLPTATPPPARMGHTLLFTPPLHGSLLFGGVDTQGASFGDSWRFDGTQWQPLPGLAPSPRHGHAMAFDSGRGRAVLFGGSLDQWSTYDDTWEHDGTAWRPVSTTTRPPSRLDHAMAYDSRRGVTVLTGGHHLLRVLPTTMDTWEYDGRDWRRAGTGFAPPARYRHSAAYATSRGVLLLAGGRDDYASFDDLWTYDGSAWSHVVPNGEAPWFRSGATLVYDGDRDRLLLLGGVIESGTYTYLQFESWQLELPAGASFVGHGRGCAGNGGTPALTATGVPRRGSTFALQVTDLPATPTPVLLVLGQGITRAFGAPLPLDLTAFGLSGCQLWIEPAPGAPLLASSQAGVASFALPLPAVPALAGAQFGMQALVLEATAPTGLGTVSNAGLVVVD